MSAWRSTGLWLAAVGVVTTTGAARVPDAAGMVHVMSAIVVSAPATLKPAAQPGGDVAATVPVAAFGPADGAPQTLRAGRSYPIVITVWVAATSGPAIVDAKTSSGRLTSCPQRVVSAGVTRLHCTLAVSPGATHQVNVDVRASTHDHGVVVSSYRHVVA